MVECHYLDHKTAKDPHFLAQISNKLPEAKNILKTCHRIEYYGEALEGRPHLFENEELGVTTIQHLPQVVGRLVGIATGIESEISAEWAIEHQVREFVAKVEDGDKTKDIGEIALILAKSLRSEFKFYAPDHAGLALGEIRKTTKSQILLVFGAGMIGKNLAQTYEDLGYSGMMLVTRNRKKAKKRIKEITPEQIVTLASIGGKILDTRCCDILIASTNLDEQYGEDIRRFIAKNPINAVVDVSASPIMHESDGAITLHSTSMEKFVAGHNESLETKKSLLKEKIESLVDGVVKDLMGKWSY